MSKKIVVPALLSIALSVNFATAEDAPSPYMSDEERDELIGLLNESRDMLMGLITGLSDEQWNFKQNPDRWSTGECAEHIVRSETALLEYALTAMGSATDEDWAERTKGKADLLRQVMPNRQPMGRGGATAPVEIRPSEKWSRAKTIEEFYKIRGKVRAYSETVEKSLKDHTSEHPFPIFSWLNAHDWLIYVPLHTIRHSRQIIEVQEDKNYPKK